jgi:hypothetical protein
MLQKNAWLWQKQNRIIRESAAALPEYRLVRFEDLFAAGSDHTTLRALMHFIDPSLALSDQTLTAFLSVKINAQPGLIPAPAWTSAQEAAFQAIAAPEMAHYYP